MATRYARLTGLLFLISMIAGGFGEFYVPSTLIVANDAALTAANILAHETMFRLGFAAYLVEATCDILLVWTFYILLRPVSRNVAFLSVLFGVLSTATFAGFELFNFAATYFVSGSKALMAFSPDQVNTLALISLKLYGMGAGVFMTFYGTAAVIRGYLIARSTFLPRVLGALLIVAGAGFMLKSLALVLLPNVNSDFLLIGMPVAGLAFTGWFLLKGVDDAKWEAAQIS
jgi:hypothetical protein